MDRDVSASRRSFQEEHRRDASAPPGGSRRGEGCYGCDKPLPPHGPYPPPVRTYCPSCLCSLVGSKVFVWRHEYVSTLCRDCFERIYLELRSAEGICWVCSAFCDETYRLHVRLGKSRVLFAACSEAHFETLLVATMRRREGRCGPCELDHATTQLEVERPALWWFDPRRWWRTSVE